MNQAARAPGGADRHARAAAVIRDARAFIFDFDGVVADTETVHYRTFAATLAERGITVTREDHASHYMGIDDRGCFRLAYERAGRETPDAPAIDTLLAEKSARYDAALEEIAIFPGFRAVFDEARRRGPTTIASCGRRRDIATVLAHHGLTALFPRFVSADEITRSKPDPECFLTAFEIVRDGTDIEPSDCLVIEDSVRGVEGARRAGMRCVALAHSFPESRLQRADVVLGNWNEWRWS